MAGSAIPYYTPDQEPVWVISGTGDGNLDGKILKGYMLIDPNSGEAMVPGAVTFTTLTITDGADICEGATADAAVSGDNAGTVSGKLRGVNKVLGTTADAAWVSNNGTMTAILKTIANNTTTGDTDLSTLHTDLGTLHTDLGTTNTDLSNANTLLADINTNLAHGQATSLTSVPVVLASDQPAVPTTNPFSTRADTFTSIVAGTTVDTHTKPVSAYSLQVKKTGSITSWTVDLEVSLDGTNFTGVLTHTSGTQTDGQIVSVTGTPALYFRSNCTAVNLGTGTNIVVTVLGI